jgi:hypothetical protein
MFTWICPKCGGEVPPAYDDCPRCAPKKAQPTQEVAAAPVATTEPSRIELPPVAAPEPVRQAPLTPPPPPREHRGMSASLIAILAFGGIAALLAALYLFVLPKQQHAAAEPEKAATVTQEQPAPTNPFAKHLEVTGVRLSGGAGGKLKVHYIVVNHSNASLPPMKMMVTLASADRTYFEFPAAVPSLGSRRALSRTNCLTGRCSGPSSESPNSADRLSHRDH